MFESKQNARHERREKHMIDDDLRSRLKFMFFCVCFWFLLNSKPYTELKLQWKKHIDRNAYAYYSERLLCTTQLSKKTHSKTTAGLTIDSSLLSQAKSSMRSRCRCSLAAAATALPSLCTHVIWAFGAGSHTCMDRFVYRVRMIGKICERNEQSKKNNQSISTITITIIVVVEVAATGRLASMIFNRRL